MKTQKKRSILFFASVTLVLLMASCSKSPMDTPVKASSINEYVISVTKIHKKLDTQEKEEFLDALEVLSGDSFEAAVMFSLTGGPSRTGEIIAESVAQFDLKTPREIIVIAKEQILYLKDKLEEAGREIDGKTSREIQVMAAEENIRVVLEEPSAAPTAEEPHPEEIRRSPTIEQQQAQNQAEKRLREVMEKSKQTD